MKIELDINAEGKNIINAYDDTSITIAGKSYTGSIVVAPDGEVENWGPEHFIDVSEQHFDQFFVLEPEIILFGTGQKLSFPSYDIMTTLATRQIGLEIMDTKAACRAYNFLVGEGREVIAALLMPNT